MGFLPLVPRVLRLDEVDIDHVRRKVPLSAPSALIPRVLRLDEFDYAWRPPLSMRYPTKPAAVPVREEPEDAAPLARPSQRLSN